jgi:hypothetical protein
MRFAHTLLISTLTLAAALTTGCAADSADLTEEQTGTASQELARARWQKLGEKRVEGSIDRDVLQVGRDEGQFNAIQLRVEGSPLVMYEVKVVFGNGETFEPNVRFFFDEGTRTRVIDLPGNTRVIKRVEFKYGNALPGFLPDAHVELYGKRVAWQELGASTVNGGNDRDSLIIGGDEGRFSSLQIRVSGSSLVMGDIRIVFGNGEVFEPRVRLVFDENSRSRVIDLPGNTRFIKRVDFRYGNLPGGGNAHVALWGTL